MAAIWHGGRFPVEGFDEASKGCMNGHLGMEIVEAGDDWLRARMPVDERTKQPFGLLHGGASVALAFRPHHPYDPIPSRKYTRPAPP